jgi:hypothetical protein
MPLQFFFSFQHEHSALRDDKIFFVLVNYFCRAAQKKNGQVPFFCLQRQVFYFLIFLFPGFIFRRHGDRITGTGFYNIALLNFLSFLHTGGKYKPLAVRSSGFVVLIKTLSPMTISFLSLLSGVICTVGLKFEVEGMRSGQI